MSNNIPTAENFLYKLLSTLKEDNKVDYLQENPEEVAYYSEEIKNYVNLHVEAALKAASEQVNLIARHYNAKTEETTFEPCEGDVYWEGHPEDQSIPDLTIEVDKQSILNAYPKENIL